MQSELRTPEQLREHYLIERELADRLRRAPKDQRRRLYSEVYGELLRRVPHHPRLRARHDPASARERQEHVERMLALVRRFVSPERALMEIGSGDCALSLRACAFARRVYALDVTDQLPPEVAPPPNFELVLIDGYSIPLPDGAVEVAMSDQLMEHLHPEDAEDQLREIHRCLAPGGVYLCMTPNRLYGPRDISEFFDDVATGMHLREYCAREIRPLFRRAGFSRLSFYVGAKGRFGTCPFPLLSLTESILDALPHRARRQLVRNRVGRAVLELRIAAFKA
ncbi:MAG TPA: class I SAM-dependent methyltransferase [Burkholderiales bacterium]|nr:class I SAM-dependent methyltransferase [Burkholderiales bacterium]